MRAGIMMMGWEIALVGATSASLVVACGADLGPESTSTTDNSGSRQATPGRTPPSTTPFVGGSGPDSPVSSTPGTPTKLLPVTPSPSPTDGVKRDQVFAPIDRVEVVVRESYPPQYSAVVDSGLPNGCTRFGDYKLTRDGSNIRITVYNVVPADKNVMCTMVYGTHTSYVDLGSSFLSGQKYTLHVNDTVKTFIAE